MSKLIVKFGRSKYRYYFDEPYFYKEWEQGSDGGTESFPLEKLSSKYSKTQGRPDGVVVRIKNAGTLLLASIVIYFSEFNVQIPLLAPVLLILGLSRFYFVKDDILPKSWTIIRYKNGEEASYILHNEKRNDERIEFEHTLSEAIDRAEKNAT